MLELNKIYCMDCLEGIKQLPEGKVVVITDPPYPNTRDLFNSTWYDGYAMLYMLCKRAEIIVFFWGNIAIPEPPNGWFENSRHIWHKPNGQSATYYENIIVWTKDNNQGVSKVWRVPIINYETLPEWQPHPTQKPIKLMRLLVQLYGSKGDYVLDPFSGSGTTLVACMNQNRPFIGFEINLEYCKIAEERLKQKSLNEQLLLEAVNG